MGSTSLHILLCLSSNMLQRVNSAEFKYSLGQGIDQLKLKMRERDNLQKKHKSLGLKVGRITKTLAAVCSNLVY